MTENKPTAVAHEHVYSKTVVPPLCLTAGYTKYVCDSCGESYTDNVIQAYGHHVWGEWTITAQPSFYAPGSKSRICQVCGITDIAAFGKAAATDTQKYLEVLRLVNEERRKAGVHELTYLFSAQSAADIRAAESLEEFSHTRPDGRGCFTVLKDKGVDYDYAGENLAGNRQTPQAVMDAWMNSEYHKQNILNPVFDAVVVSVKDDYWVQIFVGYI